jgi:hypothetical protein
MVALIAPASPVVNPWKNLPWYKPIRQCKESTGLRAYHPAFAPPLPHGHPSSNFAFFCFATDGGTWS